MARQKANKESLNGKKKLFKVVEFCGKTTVVLDACMSLIDEKKFEEFNAFFCIKINY